MQLPRYVYIAAGFVALVFVVNVLLLDIFLVKQRGDLLDFQTRLTQLSEQPGQPADTGQSLSLGLINACPQSCISLISTATSSARPSQPLVAPVVQQTVSTKGEYFVPLGSGSTSTLNTWVDIDTAQGAFDTGSFSSIKAFYFEGILRTSSGEVKARLYDTTTPMIYAGEELRSTSQTGQFLSVSIPLRSGNKSYKVQLYTTITTGYLDQARLKIVTQ